MEEKQLLFVTKISVVSLFSLCYTNTQRYRVSQVNTWQSRRYIAPVLEIPSIASTAPYLEMPHRKLSEGGRYSPGQASW